MEVINMLDFLSEPFMTSALYLGLALSIAAAFLSPFLVLSNQAMIADGMAHISFTGIIIGLLISNQPLYFAIPFAILASFAIRLLVDKVKIHNDAAISVVSVVSLSIGLIVVTVSDGFNRSIESLLIGSILTVTKEEVTLSIFLAILIALFVIIFYRKLLSMTYDSEYANFLKIKTNFLKYSLSAITAVFVVIGVKTIGVLLISAYTIFPSLIASQLSKSFKNTLSIGVIAAISAILVGFSVSYNFDLPTGPTIVIIYTAYLIMAYTTRKIIRGD
jgi:zinc transport system permease protein